jgi:hypothetical protein
MDGAVRMADDPSRMTHHLRPVPTPHEEPTYVVGRTRHSGWGTPYVVAQCVDEVVAAVLGLAGHETYRRDRMLADPSLAKALGRWEAHDHRIHERERVARAALGHAGPAPRRPPHPSVLGKLLP